MAGQNSLCRTDVIDAMAYRERLDEGVGVVAPKEMNPVNSKESAVFSTLIVCTAGEQNSRKGF